MKSAVDDLIDQANFVDIEKEYQDDLREAVENSNFGQELKPIPTPKVPPLTIKTYRHKTVQPKPASSPETS